MSEKKDVYGKAKDQMRLSERILAAIPGFHGYKEKELRRESDRLVRNHLYLKLSKMKKDLRTVSQKLSNSLWLDALRDMDHLIAKVERVSEKVNHASYGYAGFFDIVKIKEKNLDRMIDFDNNLIGDVESLAADIETFKSELITGEAKNAKEYVARIAEKLESFEETFDQRQEAILEVA